MPGRLLMPVEAAVVTMAAEAPDKPAGGLRPVDLAVNNRLHNGVQLIRRQQAKLADEIDFLSADGAQILRHLPGMVIIGIGVIVIADDIHIGVGQRKRINFLIGAIHHQLMRGPLFNPRRGLMQEIGVGILQLVTGFPGHDRLFIIIGAAGDGICPGDNLADHIQIGFEGLAIGPIKVFRFFMIERRQLLAPAPPPPVVDKRQDQTQSLFIRFGNHVVIHPHGFLIQPRHAVRRFRRQNMGLAPAGLIKFLLHRQHVDALGFRPGLHHRLDPVLLLLGRWPFKVLSPAARVCPAGAAGVVFNAVQLRRVDPGETKHLVAVLEGGAVASDKVRKVRALGGQRPAGPQRGQQPHQQQVFHRLHRSLSLEPDLGLYAEVNGIGRATAGIPAGGDGIGVPVVVTV